MYLLFTCLITLFSSILHADAADDRREDEKRYEQKRQAIQQDQDQHRQRQEDIKADEERYRIQQEAAKPTSPSSQ